MITVSLCMIVRNEEAVLARCLDSVADLADEIVIVDTGSNDRTKEIAARYTDRIYDFEWVDDFAAARNYSFSLATQDYVLWLDADDCLKERDYAKFKALKETLDLQVDSVVMEYHLSFDKVGNPAAMSRRNRLVKRSKQFRWHNPVHEYLFVEGNVYLTDIAVTHERVAPHTARNLAILEGMRSRNGGLKGRDVFYYANELFDDGRITDAKSEYERFLDTTGEYFEDYIQACARLASCYENLGNKDRKLQALLRTFVYDIPRADFCCQIGFCFQEKEDFKRAIYWFELALTLEMPLYHFHVINLMSFTWLPHYQLCVCYGMIGELRKSYEHNEKALSYMPDDPNLLDNKRKLEQALAEVEGG